MNQVGCLSFFDNGRMRLNYRGQSIDFCAVPTRRTGESLLVKLPAGRDFLLDVGPNIEYDQAVAVMNRYVK